MIEYFGQSGPTICFAHVAYRMADQFARRNTGLTHFQVWSREELAARIGEALHEIVSSAEGHLTIMAPAGDLIDPGCIIAQVAAR